MYIWIWFSARENDCYYTQNKLYLTTIQMFIYFQIKSSIIDKTVSLYWKNNRQITCLSWRTFNCVSARFWNPLNKKKNPHTHRILNNPISVATRYWYVADRHWIELPHLFVDRNQFGRAEIMVDFTYIFELVQLYQLYFTLISFLQVKSGSVLVPGQIKYKIDNFHLFSPLKLTA